MAYMAPVANEPYSLPSQSSSHGKGSISKVRGQHYSPKIRYYEGGPKNDKTYYLKRRNLGGKKIWWIRLKSAKLSSRHMIMNFFCLPPDFFFHFISHFSQFSLAPKSIQYQCFNPDFGPKNPSTVKLNSRQIFILLRVGMPIL